MFCLFCLLHGHMFAVALVTDLLCFSWLSAGPPILGHAADVHALSWGLWRSWDWDMGINVLKKDERKKDVLRYHFGLHLHYSQPV